MPPLIRRMLWLAALLPMGCAAPATPPSALEAQGVALNHRAGQAYAEGDFPRAVTLYRQSLQADRAIENTDGIAADLLDLATVYRQTGDRAAARACLAPLVNAHGLPFSASRRADASLLQALLDLDEEKTRPAALWLMRARAYCRPRCRVLGTLLNAQAALALAQGDAASAHDLAARALHENRAQGNDQETARSLRLLAATEPGQARQALMPLGQALRLDKQAGFPTGIFLDLMGLGEANERGGAWPAAKAYYLRALAVAQAIGNATQADEARARLSALGRRIRRP
ncbi:MAG: tetratricopeptide repeat protein [Betaproteobacteria bacterium]|nr:tetratricopeptide repeat protein [Betaproteobacteria bacterium]